MPDTPPTPADLDPFADWPRPLAFVLSGGGAFGSVQVGMLRALAERGVRPDLIVGSSAGALHGAVVATHPDRPDEVVSLLTELWSRLDRRAVFGARRHVVSSVLRSRSLSDGRRLEQIIDRHLDVELVEELPVRFAAVGTDLMTGDPTLLSSGSLRAALMASAAVPGVFPSVEIGGRRYVDGGVSANVPIRQAITFGAASVVCLDATPPEVASRPPTTLSGSLLHSMSLLLRNQRAHDVDDLARRVPIAVLPGVTPPDMGSFNFSRTDELIALATESSREALVDWAADGVAERGPRG